jgi:hypothetical protein
MVCLKQTAVGGIRFVKRFQQALDLYQSARMVALPAVVVMRHLNPPP